MKHWIRLTSLILCCFVLLFSMSSCLSVMHMYQEMESVLGTEVNVSTTDGGTSPQTPWDTEPPSTGSATTGPLSPPDEVPSPGLLERYPYVLQESHYTAFCEQVSKCEALLLTGIDVPAIEDGIEELEEQYYFIATQAQLAYLQYCKKLSDEDASDNYIFSSEMSTDSYTVYISMCQKLYDSQSPYRETFFSDWTEEDLTDMLSYTGELAECQKRVQEIVVEYRALEESAFDDGTCTLFAELIACNDRIAEINGYDDYVTYAYEKIYGRDYLPQDVEQMRALVKDTLIPLYMEIDSQFWGIYEGMTLAQRQVIVSLLGDDYDALQTDYLTPYLNSLPESSKKAMLDLFESNNLIMTDSPTSYVGAFTGYLWSYETPTCYFGPGYQSLSTVVHELGHYYSFFVNEGEDTALDFAEVQSQGNEMLLLAHMMSGGENDVIRAFACYQISNMLLTTIICCIVDEFEQYVYTHEIADPVTEFDAIVTQITASYEVSGFDMDEITDITQYWRMVVIESPVYYISYAVSGIMALDLHSCARQDYAAATEMYRKLVEEVPVDADMAAFVQIAGIGSPFDARTYENICKLKTK